LRHLAVAKLLFHLGNLLRQHLPHPALAFTFALALSLSLTFIALALAALALAHALRRLAHLLPERLIALLCLLVGLPQLALLTL
jgi:hypothetical protein